MSLESQVGTHASRVLSTYQAMTRIPGFFYTLSPGPNPYLPMASVYRQGIPNPYSLRSHSGRFPLK